MTPCAPIGSTVGNVAHLVFRRRLAHTQQAMAQLLPIEQVLYSGWSIYRRPAMTAPHTHDFALALDGLVSQAAQMGLSALEVRAGDLHRLVGGKDHPSDRMPACCNAMRQRMGPADEVVTSPPKGNGPTLRVRYQVRSRNNMVDAVRDNHLPGATATGVPRCPADLPGDIAQKVQELGRVWADSPHCPRVDPNVVQGWATLLRRWQADTSLPLLVRKTSMVGGSELEHKSGRKIVSTDNSPAQWSCNLALRGVIPELSDIRDGFANDSIPMSFAHKRSEREHRKYHCTLGAYSINNAGWKLCHIEPVGLNSRHSLSEIDLATLQDAFTNLLSPSNYFLLPKQWGSLGEAQDFIEGFLSRASG